jgi:hypothetical protein
MTILFWINRSRTHKNGLGPIMMRISHEGKRVNFSTGIKVNLNQWDASKQKIKGNDPMVKEYNSLLLTFTSKAWDCYNDLLKSKVLISPEVIKQKLLSKDREQQTLLGRD